MGRYIADKKYDIIFCSNQSAQRDIDNWGNNASFTPDASFMNETGITNVGLTTIASIAFPISTGTVSYNLTANRQFFIYPGCLTYVTDDSVCHQSFLDKTDKVRPIFIWDTYGKAGINFSATYPCLPILTGATQTVNATVFNVPKYVPLDSSGGVLLTQGVTNVTGVSGYNVNLQRLTFTSTGVIVGSTYVIPDTVTNDTGVAGNSIKFTFAEIASDLSYTGAVKRVLVGYLGITGTTSGTLAARLAEISGDVITYGNPVIIRSPLSSGAHRQSIHVTYHGSGSGANCFAIATTVDSGNLAVLHATSGQIVVCNPPSGLVLSGFFGTPATLFGGAAFISRVACCSLEYTTSSQLPLGYVVGISGATSGVGTGIPVIQMYQISGTTVTTTGTVVFSGATGLFSSTAQGYSNYIQFSGAQASTFPVRNVLVGNFSSTTSGGSGVFGYSIVAGTTTGSYSLFATGSGSGGYGLFRAPASLSTGQPRTIATYVREMATNEGARDIQNPFYVIPENPYSGVYFSALSIKSRPGEGTTGGPVLAIHKIDTTADTFVSTVSGGYASGICNLNTGTIYTNATGTSFVNARSGLGFHVNNSICHNIVHVIGSFPNYSRIYTLSATGFTVANTATGAIFSYNFGTSGEALKTAAQVCKLNGVGFGDDVRYPLGLIMSNPRDPQSTGFVISGTTGYYYITGASQITGTDTAIFPSTGIPVKVARNQKARTDLVDQRSPLTTIIFVKNKSVLDMS